MIFELENVNHVVEWLSTLLLNESVEGFALFLPREIMGWEHERVQVFVAEMRNALRNTKNARIIPCE